LLATPLNHDSIDEIAQDDVKDWKYGEVEPIVGKTMPKFTVVERDFRKVYEKFTTLGPNAGKSIGAHGVLWDSSEEFEELKDINGINPKNDLPSLEDAKMWQMQYSILLQRQTARLLQKGLRRYQE